MVPALAHVRTRGALAHGVQFEALDQRPSARGSCRRRARERAATRGRCGWVSGKRALPHSTGAAGAHMILVGRSVQPPPPQIAHPVRSVRRLPDGAGVSGRLPDPCPAAVGAGLLPHHPVHALLLGFAVLIWVLIGLSLGVYERLDSAHARVILRDTFRQCATGIVAVILFQYLLRLDISRSFMGLFVVHAWVLLCLFRLAGRRR